MNDRWEMFDALQRQCEFYRGELENREYEINLVKELGEAIVSELDMNNVLVLVARKAKELIQAETLLVPMINDARTHYTYVAASGLEADEIEGTTHAIHVGMCGWVLTHEKPLLFGRHKRWWTDEMTSWEEGKESAILVPLFGKRMIIGGLSGIGKMGGGSFDSRDMNLLILFANQVSIAIENAKLFREVNSLVVTLEQRVEERTTELKQANERLIQTNMAIQKAREAADAATRAKSQFLANMSHEIRTPLNGVIAAAELAAAEPLSPKLRRYLSIIESSGSALLGIINDILDFSKIEAGKLEMEFRPFRLDDVLERLGEIFISKAGEKRIEFLTFMDPDMPKAVIGDSLRLQQVLTNLIGNAFKFTEPGGVITVTMQEEPSKAGEALILRCAVKDTGLGIPPEKIDRLFEPFTQADSSITRKFGGTGLGLTISKRLVAMMDGDIGIESKVGKGSTFTFTARFQLQPLGRQNGKLSLPPTLKGYRALVIDDGHDSRSILQKTLESFGFAVELASNGTTALALLCQKKVHLILIDSLLPDMDGIELAKKIRKELRLTSPMIMMTSHNNKCDGKKAKRVGVNLLMSKPINASWLFDSILELYGIKTPETKINKQRGVSDQYESQLRGNRILVADDNQTNQEIALAVLKSVGCDAMAVGSGGEAVEAIKNNAFDMVLMDIQMPDMDGFEATRILRRDSRFTEFPIIALTAHALKGDREKCMESGMNGYVTKPIRQKDLYKEMCKFLSPKEGAPPRGESDVPGGEFFFSHHGAVPGIDTEEALKRLGFNKNVYRRILLQFHETNKYLVAEMQQAFDNQQWRSLGRIVHTLKGSAGSIGAWSLFSASLNLEKSIKEGKIGNALSILLEEVMAQLEIVHESIRNLQ